jgi:Icc-related predicted phosphoesterase
MKILAVSDVQSQGLENLVSHNPDRLKDIDLIVSCGDLHRGYLEFLVDGLNKELFFVYGNHKLDDDFDSCLSDDIADRVWEKLRSFPDKTRRRVAGQADLHGRVEVFGNYLITGFGGTLWYNGRKNQFKEQEMARVVRSVELKIKWHRMQEKLFGLPRREVIAISHAPAQNVHDQPDRCHTGFKCFRDFIRRVSPVLWLHGHIHLDSGTQNQSTRVDATTVVNVCGCKFITIGTHHIHISSRCDNFPES